MEPTTVDYGTEILIGGKIVSAEKTSSADTYFRGQRLGRITATNVYAKYDSGASNGTEIPRAICLKDVVLSAEGIVPALIVGSEIQSGGLVNSTGASFVPTTADIEALQDSGIIVKDY